MKIFSMHNNQITNYWKFCFEPEKVTDYPDIYFLLSLTHMQILHYKTSFNNMLKSIANLTISKEKLMCV